MKKSIFDIYPRLQSLRGLVPDEIVESEIKKTLDEFEKYRRLAKERIKTVRLCDIFPLELEQESIKLKNFLGHWGNVSIEEECKIALIAKYLKPKRVFEFGTYNGMTTLQLALNTPDDSEIFTLDITPDEIEKINERISEIDKYISQKFRNDFHTSLGSYFASTNEGKKIKQILSDSAKYDFSELYKAVDFIFIDAAHDYESKKIDSENALKMLTSNGVILWHNYDDVSCPDVTRYLYEFSEKLPVYHLRGTSIAIYINKKS